MVILSACFEVSAALLVRTVRQSYAVGRPACLAALCLLVLAANALAATQGSVSGQSTGTLSINVVVPPRIEIAGNGRTSLDLSSGFANHPLCIGGRGVSAYSVAAIGSGKSGRFALSAEGGDELMYKTSVLDLKTGAQTLLRAGEATQRLQLRQAPNCQKLSFSVEVLGKTGSGQGGVLTLVVAPE